MTWSHLFFQESASPTMEQLIFLHDHIMMMMMMITTIISYLLTNTLLNKKTSRNLSHNQPLETIWTSIPAIILIMIAAPSFKTLYFMEEVNKPLITLKVMGNQWYWSYEYSDFKNIEFDSYMKNTLDLTPTEFRLLEVDNRTIIPINTQIRTLISASDVLHSWTIPALGIKTDAIPGRLNQLNFSMNRMGLFFGQCSELCGANHSFMPIVIESTTSKNFISWIKSF